MMFGSGDDFIILDQYNICKVIETQSLFCFLCKKDNVNIPFGSCLQYLFPCIIINILELPAKERFQFMKEIDGISLIVAIFVFENLVGDLGNTDFKWCSVLLQPCKLFGV